MNKLALLAWALKIWLLIGQWLLAAQPQGVAVPCFDVRIIDGDTVRADLKLPFGITLPNRTIRAADYDAWECSRRRRAIQVTEAELTAGQRARDALSQLVAGGTLYAVDSGKRDPYGRLNAHFWIKRLDGWLDVAEYMREHGHTREIP